MTRANATPAKRIIVAISGASGAVYGVRLLQMLRALGSVQTHLTVSDAGLLNVQQELDMTRADLEALADVCYPVREVGAAIASGSFQCEGMVVAPCSMRVLGAVANGLSDNLMSRAADVMLKERRKLILVPRETPISLVHVKNFELLLLAGVQLIPANPHYYNRPTTVEGVADTVGARVRDHMGIAHRLSVRWQEEVD